MCGTQRTSVVSLWTTLGFLLFTIMRWALASVNTCAQQWKWAHCKLDQDTVDWKTAHLLSEPAFENSETSSGRTFKINISLLISAGRIGHTHVDDALWGVVPFIQLCNQSALPVVAVDRSTCHLVTNQPTANLSPVCNGSGQVTVMRAAEVSLGVQSSLLSIEASCCSSDISSCPPSQIQIVSKLAYLHTNNVRDYKNGPFCLIHAQNHEWLEGWGSSNCVFVLNEFV